MPLGVLVAATAGWIGYMIQQSLENALGAGRLAAQRRDGHHPGAGRSRPIRRCGIRRSSSVAGLSQKRARELAAEGHVVKADGHGKLRRVVGSPVPHGIRELPIIKTLVEKGMLVIACGGGGAPVYEHPTLGWEGIDAVVDKDLAAAVLARDLGAELLLILTDVDAVYADWGTPEQRAAAATLGRRGGRDGRAAKRSAKAAWRRRFARRSISCAAREGVRSSRRSSQGQEAVHGEAGTTIHRRNHCNRGDGVNIHEYQAKELLRNEGVPIPPGEVASTPDEAEAIAQQFGGTVVVKAQVHAGGRGKAGGVKLAKTPGRGEGDRGEDSRHADQGPAGAEGARHAGRRHRERSVRRHHPRPRVEEAGVHGEPGRRHRHRGSRRQDA